MTDVTTEVPVAEKELSAAPAAPVARPEPLDDATADDGAHVDLEDLPCDEIQRVAPAPHGLRHARDHAAEDRVAPPRPLSPERRARDHAAEDRVAPSRPLSPERRANLLAALARSAEDLAGAEGGRATRPSRRHAKLVRRLLAVGALLAPPAAAAVLLTTHAGATKLSRADAGYISEQLVAADQRLRSQLLRLRFNGTAPSAQRAREAHLTMRSLTIEVRGYGGGEALRLRRALRQAGDWIDAVGSTLANPRSPLRDELTMRDAAARAAVAALPGPSGRRSGGARTLVAYARSRVRATSSGAP